MEKDLGKTIGLPAWVKALAIVTVIQTVSAFSLRSMVVIGPELTAAAGVDSQDIGILAALASVGSIWFLLSGNTAISYWGPMRILQFGALASAAGVLTGMTGLWGVLVAAAFLVGLGNGTGPPACSEILTRVSPPARLALIISIKQAGIPLGGALAGLILPAVTAWAGWRAALLATACLAVASAAFVQPWRAWLDAARGASRRPTASNLFSWANLAVPFAALREIPGMLSLNVSVFCFASVQACMFTFFVTQLTVELGFSLAVAGAAFAAMQVSGAFSRIIMGWLADKLGSAKTLLFLAVASTAMTAVLSRIGPGWPVWLVMSLGAAIGFTSISWNGVHLAAVAKTAPPDRIGAATSGSALFTFAAFSLAPFLFTLGVAPAGGYGPCFAVMAVVQALAIPILLPLTRQFR